MSLINARSWRHSPMRRKPRSQTGKRCSRTSTTTSPITWCKLCILIQNLTYFLVVKIFIYMDRLWVISFLLGNKWTTWKNTWSCTRTNTLWKTTRSKPNQESWMLHFTWVTYSFCKVCYKLFDLWAPSKHHIYGNRNDPLVGTEKFERSVREELCARTGNNCTDR